MKILFKRMLNVVQKLRVQGLIETHNLCGKLHYKQNNIIVYDDYYVHNLYALWKWPTPERRIEMIFLITNTFDEPVKASALGTPKWSMTWSINGVQVVVSEINLGVSVIYKNQTLN
jgi:hypothetical protein